MPAETATVPESHAGHKAGRRRWYQLLGPGLITGASDDDPSGIATYAQAGAIFAYRMLWVLLFTLPMIAAIQEISARIGRVTGRGLAGNLRRYYSPWLVFPCVGLLLFANVINLGADVAAMGACAKLLFYRGSDLIYAAALSLICVLLAVFVGYVNYSSYLKWLTAALLVYVGTAFFGHVNWRETLAGTLIPRLHWNREELSMLVAVVGTTISPYLLFWQSSLETEEIKSKAADDRLKDSPEQARRQFERIRLDTYVGMTYSNLIGFFIMLTLAVSVGSRGGGKHQIDSAADAATALAQAIGLAGSGRLAAWLFSLGVIGTGMLAVPVLAGSAAYALSEIMGWQVGLNRKASRAKGFYAVLTAATMLGLGMNLIPGINPIHALVWAAIVNGIVAVPLMVVMMLMASNPKVMGKFAAVGSKLHIMGWVATAAMGLVALGMLATIGG